MTRSSRTLPSLHRLSGALFLFPVAAQAAVSLFSIPVMIESAGSSGWIAIAVGQSIGAIGAVVVSLGWGVTGPARVSVLTQRGKRETLAVSLVSKAAIAIPVLVASLAVIYLLVDSDPLAILGALAILTLAFNSTWFFVGTSDPVGLVVLDALPRVAVTATGWVMVALGSPVEIGLLAQIGGSVLAGLAVWAFRVGRGSSEFIRSRLWRRLLAEFRGQVNGVASQVIPALFNYSPVILVSLVHPSAAPLFALLDKVQKQIVTGLVPVGNVVVARAASQLSIGNRSRIETARASVWLTALVGMFGGVGVLVAGAFLVDLLSQGLFRAEGTLIWVMAGVVCWSFIAAVLPAAALAVVSSLRVATRSALFGASIGVLTAVFMTERLGALGAEIGLLVGFGVMGIWQSTYVLRLSQKSSAPRG